MFVILDDFDKREKPELYCDGNRQHAAEAVRRGGARGHGDVLRRPRRSAAWAARAGSSSWSRTAATSVTLQMTLVTGRTDNLSRQKGTDAAGEAARASPRLPRDHAAQRVPRQRPATLRQPEPRAVHDHGRAAGRRLRHAAGLLGSLYVNDFNLFGRTWQVIVQADARSATRWKTSGN